MKVRLVAFAVALLALYVVAPSVAEAQGSIGTISLQGELTDAGGNPLNGSFNMRFAIFDGPSGGARVWPTASSHEQHDEVVVSDGLFNVLLGGTGQAFSSPVFDGGDRYLQVWVCGSPGAACSAYEALTPRPPITSAAYAMTSRTLIPGAQIIAPNSYYGLSVEGGRSDDYAAAVHGHSAAQSGRTVGLFGTTSSSSDGTVGVWGTAGQGEGWGVGVLGQTGSNDPLSAGVKGTAGPGTGVVGFTQSAAGQAGVAGWSNAVSGHAYGVYGRGVSPESHGVHGRAPLTGTVGMADAHTGSAHGVVGQTNSRDKGASGVHGLIDAPDSEAYGVYGRTDSEAWGVSGVYGVATAQGEEDPDCWEDALYEDGLCFTSYGVHGESAAVLGRGVYGHATDNSTTLTSYGVYGESDAKYGRGVGGEASMIGVYGVATNRQLNDERPPIFGVYGTVEARDVHPDSVGDRSAGVYGRVESLAAEVYGVKGVVKSWQGQESAGVLGIASGQGEVGHGAGVRGEAGTWGIGVDAINRGTGIAIAAQAKDGPLFYGTTIGRGVVFRIDNLGNAYSDGAYHCASSGGAEPTVCVIQGVPADFAELLPSEGDAEPGDALVIGEGGLLTRSSRPNQTDVVGIYSANPGFLGNGQHQGDPGYVALAVLGIVSAKASAEGGAISPGDLLTTSSTPGHLMRAEKAQLGDVEFYLPGTVVGKALEGIKEGTGTIQILVSLQ